jgi:hypothetical protein
MSQSSYVELTLILEGYVYVIFVFHYVMLIKINDNQIKARNIEESFKLMSCSALNQVEINRLKCCRHIRGTKEYSLSYSTKNFKMCRKYIREYGRREKRILARSY